MQPSGQKTTFSRPTLRHAALRDTTSFSPCRLWANMVSASRQMLMTELSVVSGSCGMAPSRNPFLQSSLVTPLSALTTMGAPNQMDAGSSNRSVASLGSCIHELMRDSIAPNPKRYNPTGGFCVNRRQRDMVRGCAAACRCCCSLSNTIENSVQTTAVKMQSSCPHHGKSWIMSIPRMANFMPTPICNPLTTLTGTILLTNSIPPLTLSVVMTTPIQIPAVVTCSRSNPPAMATAAIDFMGCNGMGISHHHPVMMCTSPVQNSVGAR
mmetsp:Transcript_20166/g.57227  ORF Transcript_20166/g.57227 Transcript_20166/m.57227 type:complete len:267 (+) Transcript_20166:3449-4249(+)